MPVTSSAAPAASLSVRPDLELIQGAWRAVEGRRGARMLIAGSHFTFEFVGGDVYMGTFRLNADADPRHMDMRIDMGPAAHKGRVAHCIYHVDGDTLRWCPAVPGAGYRLTRFPSVDDDHYYCLIFHRDRPHGAR